MSSSSNWQKGWGHGEAGMETEEGTAFEFLPRREPCGERTLRPDGRTRFPRSWSSEFACSTVRMRCAG